VLEAGVKEFLALVGELGGKLFDGELAEFLNRLAGGTFLLVSH
jgi:hypothetical protein